MGDTLAAILHSEADLPRDGRAHPVVGVMFLALILAAIWFTAP